MRNASAGSWKRSGSLQADIVNLLIQGQGQPPEKKKCKAHLQQFQEEQDKVLGVRYKEGTFKAQLVSPDPA